MSAVEETPSVGSQESDTGISSEMKELGKLKLGWRENQFNWN